MDRLVVVLALNGVLVLTVSMVAGLLLYLSILNNRDQAAWHLLHAGGAGRGVMLLALAALIEVPALTDELAALAALLILFFVWTSMLSMCIRAIFGDRGLRFDGSFANRLVYVSYGLGTLAVFPGFALLIYGLFKALLPS
jgi:hypothetical protein